MIVRYLFRLFALSLSFFSLVACSDKSEEELPLGSIQTDVQEILFEGIAASQSQTVTFDAPRAWISEIHSVGSWLKASVTHGESGTSSIQLSPRSDNFNTGVREAELEILCDGCQPCVVRVKQKSAATGDIQVEGLDESGMLQLESDETGTLFCDTLWVTSTKRWQLSTDAQLGDALTFDTDGDPRQGEQTRIRVIVKVPYSRFEGTTFDGKFYIRTEEGTAVPVAVRAQALLSVYAQEYASEGEGETVSFNLSNEAQRTLFVANCFVNSNIRWTIGECPDWVECSVTVGSFGNVLPSGQLNPMRQHVAFRLKASALSRDGKSGQVTLVDTEGRKLTTLYLTFAGVGSNYIDSHLSFPAIDANGNSFGFEAKAQNADDSSTADNRKQVSRQFDVVTSTDYTSLATAPFHLLLVRADNGVARRQEVHWASLEYVGRQSSDLQGLYTHRLALRVSDRGDADDQAGLSQETEWRYAMAFLVPRSVHFDDLWGDDGHLREKYADASVLIAQKNNADADYQFGFEGVQHGGTITVPAAGGSVKLNITPGSYTQCDILLQQQNAAGEWVPLTGNVCQMDVNVNDQQQASSVTFTLSPNKGEKNPFTQQVVGEARHIRVSVNAFIGNEEGSKTIFTFYIDQELDK